MCHFHSGRVHHGPASYSHPVTSCLSTPRKVSVFFFFFITGDWSDSLSNLLQIMKASPSEAILIPPSLAIRQPAQPVTVTVVLSCSDSLAVGGQIAWHCGGALYLPHRRETRASDQAVVRMGPWSLLV